MPEQDQPRDAEALAAIRAALHTIPPPELEMLEALLERLQPLAEQGGDTIGQQARQLELQILGAMFAQLAANLRTLGTQLHQLAQWLPPDHPEQN